MEWWADIDKIFFWFPSCLAAVYLMADGFLCWLVKKKKNKERKNPVNVGEWLPCLLLKKIAPHSILLFEHLKTKEKNKLQEAIGSLTVSLSFSQLRRLYLH